LEEKERAESMKRTVERLSGLLSADELAFMKVLGQVVDERGDRAVSETARRLGLKPTRGWDLFRSIQRKAQSLERPVASLAPRRMKPSAPSRKSLDLEPTLPPSADGITVDHVSEASASHRFALVKLESIDEYDSLFGIAGAMAREEGFEKFLKKISDI
jgi:hypothetical protein